MTIKYIFMVGQLPPRTRTFQDGKVPSHPHTPFGHMILNPRNGHNLTSVKMRQIDLAMEQLQRPWSKASHSTLTENWIAVAHPNQASFPATMCLLAGWSLSIQLTKLQETCPQLKSALI